MAFPTRRLALGCALLACLALACKRPDLHADDRVETEIEGAWVRPAERGGVVGFDLQPGGRLAILNAPTMGGVAWSVSHGDLVVSTTSERVPQPNASRMRIVAHGADSLELESPGADFFAGTYRRARVERVAGVITYLGRTELPEDARAELRLARGDTLLARTRLPTGQQVPIPFELAWLPDGGAPPAVEADIRAGGRRLFATAAPVPVPAGAAATALEVVLRPVSEPE